MTTIKRREDVNPERGEKEHGDVQFADPVNNKYPIDTPKHIRAAWSYINHPDNADKYARDEVDLIKSRINRAAKEHEIDIEPEWRRSSVEDFFRIGGHRHDERSR